MNQLLCKICEKKRAKRHCPGVGGDICPNCCGTGRENTIDCPLDCEFLLEARGHEKNTPLPAAEIPNSDIRITQEFLEKHQALLYWIARALFTKMETARAVDSDAREALESLIRTYRTLDSGLIYETRPQNPYAADLVDALNKGIAEAREKIAQESGMHTLRDKDVLGVLVFLHRFAVDYDNRRKRGRAFMQFLQQVFPVEKPALAL